MKYTRRTFLQVSAGVALGACIGCDQLPAQLGFLPPARMNLGPLVSPDSVEKDEIAHVIDRTSFGPRPGDYGRVRAMGIEAYIDEQLSPENLDDAYCDWMTRRFTTLELPIGELYEYRERLLLNELTRATMARALYSERQLYEIMVGFWSDHFNIDSSKGDCAWLKTADDRDVIREHALGTFPELLRASALSPAMLWYLDGRENRKAAKDEQPNENYARELLELHTLGVHGGYTQQDVMEVARCLTGWTVRSTGAWGLGKVEFKADLHDDGPKHVLGHDIAAGRGAEDLDAVLDIVCNHPATAQYLAIKLCHKFIADDPKTQSIDSVASAFRQSGGDIPATLRGLFNTEEFRTRRGEKTKRPFRFIASALRATEAKSDIREEMLEYLVRMGQAPFQCPTPDGYPEEPDRWMGSMMWRWHFSVGLAKNEIPGTKVDWSGLLGRPGGDTGFIAGVLGRMPRTDEESAYFGSGLGPALLLASPAFQRY